jgi:hypothetical protein
MNARNREGNLIDGEPGPHLSILRRTPVGQHPAPLHIQDLDPAAMSGGDELRLAQLGEGAADRLRGQARDGRSCRCGPWGCPMAMPGGGASLRVLRGVTRKEAALQPWQLGQQRFPLLPRKTADPQGVNGLDG